jgi:hypothetical protein
MLCHAVDQQLFILSLNVGGKVCSESSVVKSCEESFGITVLNHIQTTRLPSVVTFIIEKIKCCSLFCGTNLYVILFFSGVINWLDNSAKADHPSPDKVSIVD